MLPACNSEAMQLHLDEIAIKVSPGAHAILLLDQAGWHGAKILKVPSNITLMRCGGVAAVIMELAEPRVRTGIWEHTTFRIDAIRRLRRTGLAAMVTIYGARGMAEAMIATRAAIDLTPHWLRTIAGLTDQGLNVWEAGVVRQIGAFADRLVLETNPAVQACRRLRLSANYLYVHDNAL